ncbi:MAG: hypothetical protein ACRDZY_21125, partial [Acidimicrobiales bacterium]
MLKHPVTTVAALVLITAMPTVAQAQTDGGCSSSGTRGRCWISATDPGRPGGPAAAPPSPKPQGNPGAPAISCADRPWTPPPAGDPMWAGHDPGQGALTFQLCQGDGSAQPWPRVVFAPNGEPAAAPQVSPAQLAQHAVAELGLAAPDIQLAPPADSPHGATVGFPVWMWSRRGLTTSGPVSRTATAGAISVTATATLASMTWAMGDGATVTCTGPGTPFNADDAGRSSPTCGHVYART